MNKLEKNGSIALIEQLVHISPAAWFHINLAGFYDFGEKKLEIDMEKIVSGFILNRPHKQARDDGDHNSSDIRRLRKNA